MTAKRHPIFRTIWWATNLFFCAAIVSLRKHFQRAGAALLSAPEIQQ